jgi:hypothetical protein
MLNRVVIGNRNDIEAHVAKNARDSGISTHLISLKTRCTHTLTTEWSLKVTESQVGIS